MKLHRWLILITAALVTASCGGHTVSSTQADPQSEATEVPQPGQTPATTIASPEPTTAADVIRSGHFVSGEQPTHGTAQLVRQSGGVILQLDQSFQTSTSGPDLVVVLHRSEDVLGTTQPPAYPLVEGDYTVLAPLQRYSGAQTYEIPGDINVDDYRSAVIWCRQFNATFGAAVLQ